MNDEPPVKWKANCLRFGLVPFKAYALGVPLVVLIW
jgi:hypothetical protein